ncbi:MAG: hypothetical protein M3228_00315 [Actinomycetota bacterium]|nr:hypothetical protein [Actinomycetota bacterium]
MRGDESALAQDSPGGADRGTDTAALLQVKGDRRGARLVTVFVEVLADRDDLVLEFLRGALRAGARPS